MGCVVFGGSVIADGRILLEYLQEAIKYGKVSSLSLEKLPAISKMYSENSNFYENQLWIKCEKKDFTFEELLSRFY